MTTDDDEDEQAASETTATTTQAMSFVMTAKVSADAPLHLFLGSDAVAMAEAKLREVTAELAALRPISIATDF